MKKTLVSMLVLGLVAGAMVAPADAKKKKKKPVRTERVVQGTYQAPTLVAVGGCAQTDAIGCVTIPTGVTETFLTAKVNDQHGQPVYVSVQADLNGDNQSDTIFGAFCGETTEPISVQGGITVQLWVGVSPDPGIAGCVPGEGTTGSIDVTLSNMP